MKIDQNILYFYWTLLSGLIHKKWSFCIYKFKIKNIIKIMMKKDLKYCSLNCYQVELNKLSFFNNQHYKNCKNYSHWLHSKLWKLKSKLNHCMMLWSTKAKIYWLTSWLMYCKEVNRAAIYKLNKVASKVLN